MWDWLPQTGVRDRDRFDTIVRTLEAGDRARLKVLYTWFFSLTSLYG